MVSSLMFKLAVGIFGLGTAGTIGYGIYEIVRPKSIKEILTREGLKVLNVDKNDVGDNGEWDKLVNKYKTTPLTAPFVKIKNFELSDTSENSSQTNRNSLKNKCKELIEKSYLDGKQQEYKDSKNWCVKLQTGQ